MADALELFNQFKTMMCMCPHCSNISRLSELHLRSTESVPKTWIDEYDKKKRNLEKKQEQVIQQKIVQDELIKKKKEQATQRGRRKVENMVLDSLDETSSILLKKYNPFDVKPIINPVDFVIFNGDYDAKKTKYKKKSIHEIVFFSKKSENADLLNLQKSVDECVQKKNYDFKIARISNEGSVTFE